MKKRWGAAFQIAAVYVGTVVGAGFATGKEIVEFFSSYGFFGFIGILISGYLFIYMGSKLMRIGARLKAQSYQEFNEFLFGRWAGKAVNALMLIMLLGVSAVMLSGSGAIFEEQLGLSRNIGIFATIFLALAVMVVGTKGIYAVNTFVVPMMISFSLFLMYFSVQAPGFLYHFSNVPPVGNVWKAVVSPFSYTAFNLALAQAVLVPIASEVEDDWAIKWGGMLGGAALTVILLAGHVTLIMLPGFEKYDIPMAYVMKTVAKSLYWIYVLVIYGEIFTSVIGNVFGLERQLKTYISLPTVVIVAAIFVVTYFISLVNYGTLLSFLYPLFGYVSIAFILILWAKPLPEMK